MSKKELKLIKAALTDIKAREAGVIMAYSKTAVTPSPAHLGAMADIVTAQRKRERSMFYAVPKRRIIIIAAIIALIAITLTACAFGNIILDFIITKTDRGTDFTPNRCLPNTEWSPYEISYIPDGYTRKSSYMYSSHTKSRYISDSGYIDIEQGLLSGVVSLNTELCELREMTIGGYKTYHVYTYNLYQFIWCDNNMKFLITCTDGTPFYEIEKIICGIQPTEVSLAE